MNARRFVVRVSTNRRSQWGCVGGVVCFAVGAVALGGLCLGSDLRTAKYGGGVQPASSQGSTRSMGALGVEERPMATTTVWQSGSTGDFNTAGNWTNGIPGTGADMIGVLSSTSSISLTTNLDQSGAANTFKIQSAPDYLGDIGGPANPLIIPPNSGELVLTLRSPGTSYVKLGGAFERGNVIIDAGSGTVHLDTASGADALIEHLMIKSGTVTMPGTSIAEVVVMDGPVSSLTIESGDPLNQRIFVFGGRLFLARDLGGVDNTDSELIVSAGGEVWMTGRFSNAGSGVTMRVQMAGGYVNYAPTADSSSLLPDVFVGGGWFDASDSPAAVGLGILVTGPRGRVTGSISETLPVTDYDLREPWP